MPTTLVVFAVPKHVVELYNIVGIQEKSVILQIQMEGQVVYVDYELHMVSIIH